MGEYGHNLESRHQLDDHQHHHHHGPGHNHGDGDHLHSHLQGNDARLQAEELQTMAASFIEGFRNASDKNSYLRLAGIPFQRPGSDGLQMHLVDAAIHSNWQIATASPAFGSRELVYLPYPGEMVREREVMTFTYVSLSQREDLDLLLLIGEKLR